MKRAVALHYDAEALGAHGAPVVVSSGEGDMADRMERAALHYGIPVVRDVPLAQALAELSEGEAIPEALYEPVAAILYALAEGSRA
jgi:type III secretion system FlhB-like substrate exporter